MPLPTIGRPGGRGESADSETRAVTEINMGGEYALSANKFLPPPLRAHGGGQNFNSEFKTFGFFDIKHKYKIL